MKITSSIMELVSADPGGFTMQQAVQPLKVCVVFDDAESARSAEVLIKHTTPDLSCEMQLYAFDELDPPGPGVTAARNACDTDILVVSIRDDNTLPHHVQLWLGLCLGLRDQERGGSLVVLVRKSGEIPDPDSSLQDYLETVAAIGGLAFFLQHQSKFDRHRVAGREKANLAGN